MNTINIMCEAPSLKGNIPTTSVVDLTHPSPYPSLGSTGSLGSAPPEGGVSKHPGVLVGLELGGVWAGKGRYPLEPLPPLTTLSLRPCNTSSWKRGCGFTLAHSTSSTGNPTPYRPIAPTKTTPKASSNTKTPSPPIKAINTTYHKTPTTTNKIRTATGGTKKIIQHQKKTSCTTPIYVCDGMGCAFATNSPYKFIKHQSVPHNWRPGSQNWCFQNAKALAQGNKPTGLKASSPTVFASMDIRVKKGELPPNVVQSKCVEELTQLSLASSTTEPSPPSIVLHTVAPTSTSTVQCAIPPVSPKMSLPSTPPIRCSISPALTIDDSKLYFPISYFLWKRKLPPASLTPLFPPWALFPKPKGNKIKSSFHLKWDRRLQDAPTYSFGVNDPSKGYSSQAVTVTEGVGIPILREDGSWARYSNLLVPKSKLQYAPTNQYISTSCYNFKPKRRVSRLKSGQNTNHKAHGISQKDHLKGLGKQVPSEVPCKRKLPTSVLPTPKLPSSSSICSFTTFTANKSSTMQETILHVPYPSKRTQWTRPVGGYLRGGGPPTSVTIKLTGSLPYNPINDSRMLTITCQDSEIKCSLSLIEHHSKFLKNLLRESGSCR